MSKPMEKQDLTKHSGKLSVRHLTVDGEDAGTRLDKFLARQYPEVPRTRLFRLVRKGEVRVNGKRAGIGIAVHGGSGVSFGVIEALRAARPDEAEKLELVHRLDRDTSGVLIIARKPSVLRMLHAGLREGEGFEKRYLALVKGSWQLGKKRIEAPLRTDLRVGGERTVKVAAGGKAATTDFRPVQGFGKLASLLEVSILTGRTHQIRVHAAYAGHPVAGDPKYGDREFNEEMREHGLERMFLHASSISFLWPDRGTEFSVNAPLPPELARVIDALSGLKRPGRARSRRPRSSAGR